MDALIWSLERGGKTFLIVFFFLFLFHTSADPSYLRGMAFLRKLLGRAQACCPSLLGVTRRAAASFQETHCEAVTRAFSCPHDDLERS